MQHPLFMVWVPEPLCVETYPGRRVVDTPGWHYSRSLQLLGVKGMTVWVEVPVPRTLRTHESPRIRTKSRDDDGRTLRKET